MKMIETGLAGCFLVELIDFEDERGCFFESFHKKKFVEATGLDIDFVQDNVSISKKGVLRGLHYQKGDDSQAKLVQVIKGKVLDVILDLRKESETYGEYRKYLLSSTNKRQIFIPKGFAHGFVTLSEEAIFCYKCDSFYNSQSESGVRFDDSQLNIDWEYSHDDLIISEKDRQLPYLKDLFK
ncbi:dTDP-4-dehydrorhamnose 3,5-epimerase [Euzebyella marina]|uniref:dTDP-4-dehydrorhamnose 3,5-epimerase n=1 Tax=Euzebyella marina TaxID=1761453 RepID=A0A3G2L1F8_9FLAO|nr:dTDP-4-dehydrorhamnose 3,5-epimerase [Euzebyella marina]AYN66084.1 dTDP-4-dehydrorhamnose 3,5-epimerase [Euzebyella marina]